MDSTETPVCCARVSEAARHDYRIGATLGVGAIASVVEVTGPNGERYAAKLLHASQQLDEAATARFEQEAALLERLDHPNLVHAHGFVDIDGQRVLLLELVEGPTLAQVIAASAPLPERRLLALARGIAAGLAHAHAAGVIHRDLKPSNVLVASGDVAKIVDFGMARASSLAGVDRNAFTIIGTPDYMAPECVDPLAVDPRSDLYALGCIVFEMATGAPPFGAATALGLLEQHRRSPAPRLPDGHRGRAPGSGRSDAPETGVSEGLRALVDALLAKSPADRPQAASTVVASLDRLIAGETALVPLTEAKLAGVAACAGCGQALVLAVGVCMNCGLLTAKFEPGEHTLLVAGPGEVGDKIDTDARARLIEWIAANPGLAMDEGELRKQIPRLPFTLATGISEASGQAIALSLERLGITTELVPGGAWGSLAMRQKVKSLSGRVIGIMFASMAGLFGQLKAGVLVVVPLAIAVALGLTFWRSTKRLTKPRAQQQAALPVAVERSLRTVEHTLPAIEQGRHRHGLRAVVERAVRLAGQPELGADAGEELGTAIELASVAASRLDTLDRSLAQHQFDESSPEARALLHERDTWAARLLDLTAQLDALAARLATVRAGERTHERELALADLRALVEGLEEVQAR
jgi:serine/threonine-protein kinase